MTRRFSPVLWVASIVVMSALRCMTASAGSGCFRLPFHEDFARSSAIFVGTPVKNENLFETCSPAFWRLPKSDPLYEKWKGRSVKVTLKVDVSFKGPSEEGLIEVLTGDLCTEGVTSFELGQQYLVYTVRNDSEGNAETEGIDRIEICSRTDKIEFLQRDLYYLRQIKAQPDSGGTVFGKLVDEEGILDHPPKVLLTSEKGSRRVNVGRSGEIHLTHLERGSYQLTVHLPRSLDPDPIMLDFAIRSPESVIELPMVYLRPAGRIEGRLIQPDGRPAFGFQVTGRLVARTGRDGRFVLRHLRAGKAFPLSVCVPGSEVAAGEASNECTYYPGVGDPSYAQPITLESGQVLILPDLPIPWMSQPCSLTGIVLKPNGERAAGTRMTDYLSWKVSEPPHFADSAGAFEYRLSVHEPHNLSFCYEAEQDGKRLVYLARTRIEAGFCPAEAITIELASAITCGAAQSAVP